MIFLVGLMGCGKSKIGKAVAKKCNYNFVDLDTYIEKKLNKKIDQIFEEFDEEYFRKIEFLCLYEIINNESKTTIVACGGGTPCFYNNIDLMNKSGTTIWLNPTLKLIANNIINDKKNKRPLLKNTNENEIIEKLETILQARINFYGKANYVLTNLKTFEMDIVQLINS